MNKYQVLEQKFLKNTNIFKIRSIIMLNTQDIYLYLENNFIIGTEINTNKRKFYSIYGDLIEYNNRLTHQFYKHIKVIPERIIFLDNWLIVIQKDSILKININNLSKTEVVKYSFLPNFGQYSQINRTQFSFYVGNTSKIYQLSNIKYSKRIFHKCDVSSYQYHKGLVQAISNKQIYYYDIKMTKQIRKYRNQYKLSQTLNSNYLFVLQNDENNMSSKIKIYDISSMRIVGTIIADKRWYEFISCHQSLQYCCYSIYLSN